MSTNKYGPTVHTTDSTTMEPEKLSTSTVSRMYIMVASIIIAFMVVTSYMNLSRLGFERILMLSSSGNETDQVQQLGFDWTIANTSLWLSAATYCDVSTYSNRTFKGYSTDFVLTDIIYAKKYDVQGFTGVMENQKNIYVAYRGSSSLRDWINNVDTKVEKYPNCTNCEVHVGFYQAESAVIDTVKHYVNKLLTQNPDYSVVVTGHSLGGALATLTSMELTRNTTRPVRLINFGSPRVGNKEFAVFASKLIKERYRVTHYRDVVPHLPWTERFTHISGEWYEDKTGTLYECDGYEDRNCAYQWYYLTVEDHLQYLDFQISSCEAVS